MGEDFYFLAVDMGGTNSRFALFKKDKDGIFIVSEEWLSTQHYTCFGDLVDAARKNTKVFREDLRFGALAAPGHLKDLVFRAPNISWVIEAKELQAKLGLPNIYAANDFKAQAYACMCAEKYDVEDELDIHIIWPGTPRDEGPMAVVGAGSGFGKAVALPRLDIVLPSEGGHATFPFMLGIETGYARFLGEKYCTDKLSGDHVLGGRGLSFLYCFHSGEDLPATQVVELLSQPDLDDNAEKTLAWYARFYGRFCRNFILDTVPLRGLYISGGMAHRVPVLSRPEFLDALHNYEAQKWLLKEIPVYHVNSLRAGLYGAACFGLDSFEKNHV